MTLIGFSRPLACSLVFLCLAGCLSRPPLTRQSFGMEVPQIEKLVPRPVAGNLAIKAAEVAALYDSRALVYRLPNLAYERDPYADWLVLPSRMVEGAVAGGIRQSGLFSEVLERGSGLAPDLWLETHVDRLCGDFSQPGEAQALVEIQFRLVCTRREGPPAILLSKIYSCRVPLTRRTASEVVSGCDRGVQTATRELIGDLQSLAAKGLLGTKP